MSVSNGPTYKNLESQEIIGAIFNDRLQNPRSCTMNLTNDNAENFSEVPAGTVLAKTWTGKFSPCAYDTAGAAVTGTVITCAEDQNAPTSQFKKGDYLFVGSATYPVKITAVDKTAKQLTVESSTTVALDDALVVDPSKSVATVDAGTSTNSATFETADDYKKFRVGDVINIDGVTGARNITAIDSGTNTITFDGATASFSAGAYCVSQARAQYRIMTKTVYTQGDAGMDSSNVFAHYRTRGEAFAKKVRGMSPTIKASLEPLVEFSNAKV